MTYGTTLLLDTTPGDKNENIKMATFSLGNILHHPSGQYTCQTKVEYYHPPVDGGRGHTVVLYVVRTSFGSVHHGGRRRLRTGAEIFPTGGGRSPRAERGCGPLDTIVSDTVCHERFALRPYVTDPAARTPRPAVAALDGIVSAARATPATGGARFAPVTVPAVTARRLEPRAPAISVTRLKVSSPLLSIS